MAPHGGGEPSGVVKDTIVKDFGDFATFKKQFSDAAAGHFGSGWAWLVLDPNDKKLKVVQTHDAGCPIKGIVYYQYYSYSDGHIPILTCDVWEHAYYIDYRNDRAKYIDSKLLNAQPLLFQLGGTPSIGNLLSKISQRPNIRCLFSLSINSLSCP